MRKNEFLTTPKLRSLALQESLENHQDTVELLSVTSNDVAFSMPWKDLKDLTELKNGNSGTAQSTKRI